MYLRTKAIRNKKTGAIYHYAYAVESRWRKKGARQRVVQYLGKVHVFSLALDIEFFAFVRVGEGKKEEFLKGLTARELISSLVEWEFAKHKVEGFSLDFGSGRIEKDGKPASIAMNEGMLNTFTLRRLLMFKAQKGDEDAGYQLAKAFVEAGIKVPEEVFILVFGKFIDQK